MKTTAAQLTSRLWAAFDASRGSMEVGEALPLVLALLFLKRSSDHADEDTSAPQPAPSARWSAIRAVEPRRLVDALNRGLTEVERSNDVIPRGLLTELDFERWARGGDRGLPLALDCLAGVGLRDEDLEPSALGDAIDGLFERFANAAGRRDAAFVTPPDLGELMVKLLDPRPGEQINDPVCGIGSLLLRCAAHAGGDCELTGQEISRSTWRLAGLNFLLRGRSAAGLACGNTLLMPLHLDGKSLRRFDAVIADPPYSIRDWGRDQADPDPFGRFKYGVPPAGNADMAFLQHVVASLKPDGRAVVLVPAGVLFREGTEGQIRRHLIEDDVVDSVIALAPNLMFGTAIPVAILTLTRKKAPKRRGKVLIVDATKEYQQARGRNNLLQEHIESIVSMSRAFKSSEWAMVATHADLAARDFSLHVARYFDRPQEHERVDLDALRARIGELDAKRAVATERMDQILASMLRRFS